MIRVLRSRFPFAGLGKDSLSEVFVIGFGFTFYLISHILYLANTTDGGQGTADVT
jgi:hypothetical protein